MPVVVVVLLALVVLAIWLARRSPIGHRYLYWPMWDGARKDTNRTLETYAAELEVEESFQRQEKDPAP